MSTARQSQCEQIAEQLKKVRADKAKAREDLNEANRTYNFAGTYAARLQLLAQREAALELAFRQAGGGESEYLRSTASFSSMGQRRD